MATVFSDSKTTLKDIADIVGCSVATAHRALARKEGVSWELAERIRQTAEAMDYSSNPVAAALKREQINIAVVLPNPNYYGKYYFSYMVRGWRDCYADRCAGFNVNVMEYLFDCDLSNDEERQLEQLALIFREWKDKPLSGLLISPMSLSEKMTMALERFTLRGTQVVTIDGDLQDSGRLCCVSPEDKYTGNLAAELLCSQIHQESGTILIASNNEKHRSNVEGFTEYIEKNRPSLKVVCSSYDNDDQAFFKMFTGCSDLVAAYSARAQTSLPMCQAVMAMGKDKQVRLVASDLFPETARLLEQGVLDAIIYKNPYEKAYRGFELLLNYLIRNIRPKEEREYVPISIILQSNLRFYERYL